MKNNIKFYTYTGKVIELWKTDGSSGFWKKKGKDDWIESPWVLRAINNPDFMYRNRKGIRKITKYEAALLL